MSILQAPATMVLSDVRPGRFRCEAIQATGQDEIRLKRLGLCEGRVFDLVGRGDPMVLRIGESRVGLSRQLARAVSVSRCELMD